MAKDSTVPTDNRDFEQKHADELGVKRFAYIQGLYTVVPLAAAAIGGLIGYVSLGKPLTKMFPATFKFAGGIEKVIKTAKNITPEKIAEAK